MIIVAKKRTVLIILLIVIIAIVGVGATVMAVHTVSPQKKYVIVIDPGHGGIDYGVVGSNGTKESEFNLAMSSDLKMFLVSADFEVVLTRKDNNGLYGEQTDNFKRKDMQMRKQIIVEQNPDMIISIHANKFPDKNRRGAQVFYDSLNEGGKALAQGIQSNLNLLNLEHVERTFSALSGDYFMLKCSNSPSVIIECGFLSNAEDEMLLNQESYRKQLSFAIYSGIIAFLETL